MATMSATMKQFTKGLKTHLEPIKTSLTNIEQSLVVTAEASQVSREDEVENKKAEKEKLDEEKKQTSWLKKLFGKKDEKGEGGGFFTRHWRKILLGIGALLLFLPKQWIKNLFDPKWWKDNAWIIGGTLAGALLFYLGAPAVWSGVASAIGGALFAWWKTRGMGVPGGDAVSYTHLTLPTSDLV